ncbi:MAG: DUF4920 domain-containing protein [Myxococcales bacterium]|nr:DUF4920 domain-containing protein [Myxococcales bacterium]
MRKPFLLSCVLVAACSNPASAPAPAAAPKAEPAPAAQPAAPAADAKVAAAPAAGHAEDEEGCIYKDAGKPHGDEADCPHGGHGDAPAGTGVPGHFGAAFALKDSKPLATVLTSNEFKAPVQVSGTVDSVCQKAGCWLVVKDGEAQARILMKDHAFTAPMDCKGKNVVVEGTLEARKFTEAQVKHLEKDAGKDPAAVSGERTEYVLTATALELKS